MHILGTSGGERLRGFRSIFTGLMGYIKVLRAFQGVSGDSRDVPKAYRRFQGFSVAFQGVSKKILGDFR